MKKILLTLVFDTLYLLSFGQHTSSCEDALKTPNFKGKCFEYSEEKELLQTGYVDNGIKIGRWTSYYDNGKVKEIKTYNDHGQLNGPRKFYSSNGQLINLDPYKNGKIHGKSKMYYLDGSIKKIAFYTHGQLDGYLKEWDENGNLIKVEFHDKGKIKEINVIR